MGFNSLNFSGQTSTSPTGTEIIAATVNQESNDENARLWHAAILNAILQNKTHLNRSCGIILAIENYYLL